MKRFASIIISLMLLMAAPGCNQAAKPGDTGRGGKISVVCTVFPQYDWVRQILGNKTDSMELTLLLNTGVDLHNYQATVSDIIKISSCDLFIHVGGESDKWVEDVLDQAPNPDMTVINLLDELGSAAKEEEIVEGMEDDGGNGGDYDEHVWLSLKNAKIFCSAITDKLSELDPVNAGEYRSNLTAYTEKLSNLDTRYQETINAAPVRMLLFGDRFPFRYLVDDYGLKYYAAFPGCSAETEASFETIVFLAEKADELSLKSVVVTEGASRSVAETIIGNTADKNQRILALNDMQSVKASDIENGTTYLSVMENNLNTLKEALK